MKNNLFKALTGRACSHLQNINDYLFHTEAIDSFQKLQSLAKQETEINLQPISSFRNFEDQCRIWNSKVSGERAIYDENNKIIRPSKVNTETLLSSIMRFSAIPGTSRHHWGSDIDIYDATSIKKEDVKLTHSECIGDGENAKLHLWLDEKIKKGESFGFFRPYEKDRGGVSVEKWHISYAPISENYLASYTLDTFLQNLEDESILMSSDLREKAESIYNNYIINITPPPFKQ